MNEPSNDIVLNQFSTLTKALIDASSIIYSSKAGFLDKLGKTIRLYTIPEIFSETFHDYENIKIIKHNFDDIPNDKKLISVAINQNIPVISEDKKILKALENVNKPFFNSLMMLNFLLFKNQISVTEFFQKRSRLKKIARYGKTIWDFGDSVFNSLK